MRHPQRHPSAGALLEDPLRKRMFQMVEARPGVTAGRLRELLGIRWDGYALAAHELEAHGLLKPLAVGRTIIYYACTTPEATQQDARRFALLLNPLRAKIARVVRDEPGLDAADLPPLVGESPRAVYHHLGPLARAALISRESEVGWRNLGPGKDLDALLSQLDAMLA